MGTRVRSYSKVNLGLRIGPVRSDGFHGLATVYQTLELHDVVTVSARRTEGETRIVIRTDDPRVPVDGRNTAWAMVERALARAGMRAEVEIGIEKRLPVQGGMGAGSANAAAALLGMERELGVLAGEAGWLTEGDRMEVASAVGSDVPLFLVGGTVLGEGRGEVVSPLPELAGEEGVACVVAVPRVGVSTPMAFRRWDEGVLTDGLTADAAQDRLSELSRVYASCFAERLAPGSSGIGLSPEFSVCGPEGDGSDRVRVDLLVRAGIENDFEEVVFSFHPSLRDTKRQLMGDGPDGAVYAALSGSGSALFGLYRSERDAEAAQQRVRAAGTVALRTRTLSRSQYWRNVFAEEKANDELVQRVD